jgi:1-deoxy-D-xylulose-5-phosphate reductoisomerase
MRVPIGYALGYPDRLPSQHGVNGDVLAALGAKRGEAALRYDFEAPDDARFPCVRLAYDALAAGGTQPAVLSAANEVAVAAFVEGRIGFGHIAGVIEGAMSRARTHEPSLNGVRTADREARKAAGDIVDAIEGGR